MRTWLLLAAAPLLTSSLSSFALANENAPVLVTAPISKVFVPSGFDDNDNAEIILRGNFPSTCYKIGPASANVDIAARKIIVDAKAWSYQGGACADMMVPFLQPIKLGLVPSGTYDIVVLDRPGAKVEKMHIDFANTRDPDDFLYAPVEQVSIDHNDAGRPKVVVEGHYPMMLIGCMKIVELREYTTPGQVIVVQPIAQIFTDSADCRDQAPNKRYRFEQTITDASEPVEYLAHVRSLAGHSLNQLVDLSK